ncbi:DNA gyrase inhibitor YacG [Pseudoduganella sp. UC29_106]|uniref:DNA gyrase inhibitor YacG n=1 Tax=Pseudoduganella sp. UC29_106 TaxID=3374553 RepID=UPI003757D4E4
MPTVVECPTCHKKVEWTEANKFRPFCSERCKQIDLGAWAEEKYRVPGSEPDPEDETPAGQ